MSNPLDEFADSLGRDPELEQTIETLERVAEVAAVFYGQLCAAGFDDTFAQQGALAFITGQCHAVKPRK